MPFVQTITRSLLDRDAATLIARQLWAARQRLHLHAGGHIPGAVELAITLRLHMQERDSARTAHAARSSAVAPPVPADAPPLPLLHFLLDVADAAYLLNEPAQLRAELQRLALPALPLASRATAEKWAPGFVLVLDARRHALLLSIRGSREVGDLITNLSTDVTPFLTGAAHAGIAAAARNLHDSLRPTLASALHTHRPRNGLLVVGHSLGGAAAAALVMLLREGPAPLREHPAATAALRLSRCYAFAPPPFVTPELARRAATMPIFTIVYGLDVIPRLSAASIDRLLAILATYDWTSRIGSRIGAAVSDVMREVGLGVGNTNAPAAVDTAAAHADPVHRDHVAEAGVSVPALPPMRSRAVSSPSPGASVDHGVLANVSGTIATVADSALQARGLVPSTTLGAAVNAALFVTRALGRGVQGNARRVEAAASRTVVHAESETDGASGRGGALAEVLLAGEIWHIVPRFRAAAEASRALLPGEIAVVRRAARFFRDVEVSTWMTFDHYPRPMREALQTARRRDDSGGGVAGGRAHGLERRYTYS